jgi:hypothetical protein
MVILYSSVTSAGIHHQPLSVSQYRDILARRGFYGTKRPYIDPRSLTHKLAGLHLFSHCDNPMHFIGLLMGCHWLNDTDNYCHIFMPSDAGITTLRWYTWDYCVFWMISLYISRKCRHDNHMFVHTFLHVVVYTFLMLDDISGYTCYVSPTIYLITLSYK